MLRGLILLAWRLPALKTRADADSYAEYFYKRNLYL